MPPMSAWQQRAWTQWGGALAAERLGHALLLAGPTTLGTRELARMLAQRLLCSQPAEAHGPACGNCRGCRLFGAGSHPDFTHVTLQVNEKTDRLRSEISVDQIRSLGQWLSLTAQFGGRQVALIEPAELMRHAAANALLKSLEEPLPGRHLVLVTAHPASLPATIRSRCQRIELRLPPASEARLWMIEQGVETAQLDEALSAAEGDPGLAINYLTQRRLGLRDEVHRDLAALAAAREQPMAVALRWIGDALAERLRFAAEAARDLARWQLSGRPDPALLRAGLTATGDVPKLAVWFDEANRTRALLDAPLRPDLLVTGLLLGWKAALRP